MKKYRILLTGASGFIGSAVAERLSLDPSYMMTASGRATHIVGIDDYFQIEDPSHPESWSEALVDQNVVIHMAAQSVTKRSSEHSLLDEFRAANVRPTLALARQAVRAGVSRFIFISSAKVNGEISYEVPFRPTDRPNYRGPYGQSKFEAEEGLMEIAAASGLEVVIIRPPVVYGPGVKGNFRQLMNLACVPFPMPFGLVTNKRSLLGLDNLVDFIITCIEHPLASNRVFMVSDGNDLSTPELLTKISDASNCSVRLWRIPIPLLRSVALVSRTELIMSRLIDSLQVDITENERLLGWFPGVSVDEGLRRCFGNN